MTKVSFVRTLARFGFAWAALCGAARTAGAQEAPAAGTVTPPEPPPYTAWQGNAPAPPQIVLRPSPAPELAPLEYARRPFELVPEFVLAFPSCSDGSGNDARCSGLGAGEGFGATALWRASPYFAFGGTFSALRFGFAPPGSAALSDASASGLFYGLLGRVYFADHGVVEPYLELGLGGGANQTTARESDAVQYSETAAGGALRVGGAVEFYLGRHVRLGPALAWTRFRVTEVRRCDAARACTELDPDSAGHGVGFTTLSVRLSILVGPGL